MNKGCTRIGCSISMLHQALAGTLDSESQTHIEQHLSECDACQSQIAEIAGDTEDWDTVRESLSDQAIRAENGPASEFHYIMELAENQQTGFEPLLDRPAHPETLGAIDGFEVEQFIGRGGMGIVYRGFDRELNRPVAIKFLAPHLAASGVARKRFAREARAAAAVVHPNIVSIHSVSSSQDRPYLVMSLVPGRSLQKHVEVHGPLPVTDIVRIGQQIAAGLSAAHEHGVVHRDIKPANILLEKDVSRVMITDFGLARAADDAALTQSGWLAGTPHYMSPEQAMGEPIDHRSDLFSLGSVMFFMATGREPFRAEKSWAVLQKIGTSSPQPIRSINSQIPKSLAQIVDALMHKSADRRIQSAAEANQLLTDYLAHLQNPSVVREPKPPRKPKRIGGGRFSRHRLVVLLAILGLLTAFSFFGNPNNRWLLDKGTVLGIQQSSSSPLVETPAYTQNQMMNSGVSVTPMPPAIGDGQLEMQLSSLGRDIFRLESDQDTKREVGVDQFQLEIEAAEQQLSNLEQQLNR